MPQNGDGTAARLAGTLIPLAGPLEAPKSMTKSAIS